MNTFKVNIASSNSKIHKTSNSTDAMVTENNSNTINDITASKRIAKQVKIAELEKKLFTSNFKHKL